MTRLMKASILAVHLLKEVEGWRDKPYRDSGGKCTIGWGHLIKEGEYCPDKITVEQGEKYLSDDIAKAERAINKTVKVPLKQNQFDSLVSFVYNIGVEAWTTCDSLGILNSGERHRMPARMMMWVKVDKNGVKVVDEGLINRRLKEADLWRGK